MAKYSKGEKVDFKRNSIVFSKNVSVSAVLEPSSDIQQYIVENPYGWEADVVRKKLYELESGKKYLFVKESELTALA